MIDIAKKKLPSPAIAALVYISYCAVNWFIMRGHMAYLAFQSDMSWIANDLWAFFIGGLIPFVLYEVLTTFLAKPLQMKVGGDIKSLRYGLNYAVIGANVFLFLLKFMYIAIPLYAPVIDILLDPIITLGFVALYCWYAFYRDYVDRTRFNVVLTHVMGGFFAVYGILAFIELIMAVA